VALRNHPSAIERLNYLQGQATKCRSSQAQLHEESPTPATEVVAIAPEASTSDGQTGWKLVQNPNAGWHFTIKEQFIFGERMLPDERKQLGDFDTVDVKKLGNQFVGTQRTRRTFKVRDTSSQGFHYKTCRWDFAVELTSVTSDRIEGRWEGYPHDSTLDPVTCERSGERIWEDATWIRE
jgi:hypothetical protein